MKIYANILDANSLTETENGWEKLQTVHISGAKTQGQINHEINSMQDFKNLLANNPKVNCAMFYFHSCPRKGTTTEKALFWVKRLLMTQARMEVVNG